MTWCRFFLIKMQIIVAGIVLTSVATPAADYRYLAYVGTYTDKDSRGIYAYRFDPASGEAESVGLAAETQNPSFLAVNPNYKFLYAVNEIDTFEGASTGAISAFVIDKQSGKLRQLQQISSAGAGPAHISVDKTGRYVLVANYNSGNIAVFPIESDGRLGPRTAFVQHTGSSVDKERQSSPHAHEIQASNDNRFVFVPDLGLDELLIYRFDSTSGTLAASRPPFVKVSPGSGPRHLAVSPSGRFIYLVNELSSTVTVFSYDVSSGRLQRQQTISTLAREFKGENTTAEIETDASGRFLYVSNRGEDSIAVLGIDRQGKLSLVQRVPTGGKTPRHFRLDPTGKWMFVANQDSDTINLFTVDPASGRLTATSRSLKAPSPVCLVFVPLS